MNNARNSPHGQLGHNVKASIKNNRLGFLLTEEETERVVEIMDYQGLPPEMFAQHCIEVLWAAYEEAN